MVVEFKYDKYGYKKSFIESAKKDNGKLGKEGEYSAGTKKQWKFALNKCNRFEEFKDICEFTFEEFTELAKHLLDNPENEQKKVGTVRKDISYLLNYLDFCEKKGNAILTRKIVEENYRKYGDVEDWLQGLIGIDKDYTKN